jgi:hypothetical protein
MFSLIDHKRSSLSLSNIFLGHFSKIAGMYLETDRDWSQTETTQPERYPMITTTHPDAMTAEARLSEAAAILAAGVIRVLEKQKTENFSVDIPPRKRPYVRKNQPKGERT